MKYGILQHAMWILFSKNYKKALSTIFNESEPCCVMKAAHRQYKKILTNIPKFDKDSLFLFNILSCAALSAVLLSTENKYSLETVQLYYHTAMDNRIIHIFAKNNRAYTPRGRAALKKAAQKSQRITNPYDWKFTVTDGSTINEYTATFSTCGICTLMNKLGLGEYITAMCTFDYNMAAMNNTTFSRKYTLAEGGKYCDCHYKHNPN